MIPQLSITGSQAMPGYLHSSFSNILEHPYLKFTLSAIYGVLFALFGPWTEVHFAALVFLMLDQFTGTWKACREGKFSPTILRKATAGKVIIYSIAFILAYLLSTISNDAEQSTQVFKRIFHEGNLLVNMVGFWIAVTEWESIGRNAQAMGKKFPTISGLYAAFGRALNFIKPRSKT